MNKSAPLYMDFCKDKKLDKGKVMTLSSRLAERGDDDIEERFGFVLMLDGLGVSQLNQREQRDWLKRRNEMIRHLDAQQQFHLERYEKIVGDMIEQASGIGMPQEIINKMNVAIKIYKEFQDNSSFATFGDTVIFHGSISKQYNTSENYFDIIAQTIFSLIEVMKSNIKFDLRLRGSAALGDFLVATKSDTIMGKALIDAYKSYERVNWIGIVLAPGDAEDAMVKAFSFASDLINRFGIEAATRIDWWNLGISYNQRVALMLCDLIVKFPVQYKSDSCAIHERKYEQREMWTPAWPIFIHLDKIDEESIAKISMPDKKMADKAIATIQAAKTSSEEQYREKYANTMQFYEHIWDLRSRSL